MHELSERAELVRLHGRAQAIPSSEIDRILLSIDSSTTTAWMGHRMGAGGRRAACAG